MSSKVDAVMSTPHMVLYATVGLLFVLLGGWRMRNGMSFKPAGLAIGLMILIVIASAQFGIVSLEGVEACMKEKSRPQQNTVVPFSRSDGIAITLSATELLYGCSVCC